MFVEQKLRDQPEGSWAQGTVEGTWLRGLRHQRGVCHLHHLDLDEVTRGCGGVAIIRHQDLGGWDGEKTRSLWTLPQGLPNMPHLLNTHLLCSIRGPSTSRSCPPSSGILQYLSQDFHSYPKAHHKCSHFPLLPQLEASYFLARQLKKPPEQNPCFYACSLPKAA